MSIYNPIDRKIEKDYICLGNVPQDILRELKKAKPSVPKLKKYFGPNWKILSTIKSAPRSQLGGAEFEFTEDDLKIDAEVPEDEESPTVDFQIAKEESQGNYMSGPNIEYRVYPQFFPDDNFIDIKNKITLLSGIPMYNQFLFWGYRGLENHTYDITVDGVEWSFTHQQPQDATISLYDLQVDKNMYMNRNSLGFLVKDQVLLINNSFPAVYRVYVIDAEMYLAKIRDKAENIISDTYLFDLLYYGIIKKYFPIYQPDILRNALLKKYTDIAELYPDIAPSVESLTRQYTIEQGILNNIYKLSGKSSEMELSKQIYISVSQAILEVINTFGKNTNINLRNLFDIFETNEEYPYVAVAVKHQGKLYWLQKLYGTTNLDDIDPNSFPVEFDQSLVVYTRTGMIFGIDDTGAILIHKRWFEEDFVDFTDILEETEKTINPLIKYLNTKRNLFIDGSIGELNYISKKSLLFSSVNSSIVWKQRISKEAFKFLNSELNKWEDAQMLRRKPIQSNDIISFRLRKGINRYTYNQLNRTFGVTDEYVYLTNPSSYQKLWTQFYGGKSVNIYHRNISVKFESLNMENIEFQFLYYICRALCYEMMQFKTPTFTRKKENQLKKLFEMDPKLYDLRKTDSNKLYSVVVQKKYRPNILTLDEYEALSPADKKRVYKYWNFTTEKPAYYLCPNRKIPYLNFTPDVHPEGYCLPRCTSSKPQGDKNILVYNTCMEKHEIQIEKQKKIKHIVKYGKFLNPGRLSHLPQSVKQILVDPNAVILGVEEEPSSLINSVQQMLPEVDLIGEIIGAISSTPEIWADSQASIHFASVEDFILEIREVFLKNKEKMSYAWDDIFLDIITPVTGYKLVIFNDLPEQEIFLSYPRGATVLNSEKTLLLMRTEIFNPIMFREDRALIAQPSAKILDFIANFYMTSRFENTATRVPRLGDFKKSQIATYFMNETHCYAIQLKNGVYLEIEPVEVPVEKSMKVTFNVVDCKKTSTLQALLKELDRLLVDYVLLRVAGAFIGARYGDGMMGLCRSTIKFPGSDEYNVSTLLYEPYKINEEIFNESHTTYTNKKAVEAIYNNYLYQILRNTFIISYRTSDYGKRIRAEIVKIAKRSLQSKKRVLEGFAQNLAKIIGPEDVELINEKYNKLALNSITFDIFKDFLYNSFFEFDREKLRRLRSDPKIAEKVHKNLLKHVDFVQERSLQFDQEMPNILYPCISQSTKEDSLFCSGCKLKISREKFKDFVEILVSDLQGNLTYQDMILNISQNNVIDFFQFEKHKFERILIEEI